MPMLENQRHERFAQAIVSGRAVGEAYVEAGYKPSPSSPSRLLENARIKERIQELSGRHAVKIVLTKQYVIEALIENMEKSLGRRPVKIGKSEKDQTPKEVFVYRGDVANGAIKMLGSELGLFIERKEIKHLTEFDDLSDEELLLELSAEAQKLLEHSPADGGDGQE